MRKIILDEEHFINKDDIVLVVLEKKIYHVANPIMRDKILKNWIKIYRGVQWLEDTPLIWKAVFATNSLNQDEWFDSTYDDDIWEIDTKWLNIQFYRDPNFLWNDKYKHIVAFQSIPAKFLKLYKEWTWESLE